MEMVDAIVTGSTGFLARNLIRALILLDRKVLAISRSGYRVIEPTNDITKKLETREIFDLKISNSAQTWFHTSAFIPSSPVSEDSCLECVRINSIESLRALETAISLKVPHFIFYSTANAYVHDGEIKDENTSWDIEHRPDYFASKLLGEKLLQKRIIGESTKLTILRLGSLYGPGEPERNLLPTIIQSARAKRQIRIVNNGLNSHNFLFIADAVQGSLLASEHSHGDVFNIGAVNSITLKELVQKLSRFFDDLEMLVKYSPFETDAWSGCAPFSIKKAQNSLHFNPTSLENNLESYVRAYLGIAT